MFAWRGKVSYDYLAQQEEQTMKLTPAAATFVRMEAITPWVARTVGNSGGTTSSQNEVKTTGALTHFFSMENSI